MAAYLFIQITKDTAVAEETKAVVQKEENEAAEKARETQAIADDAQRDLNEALPALVWTVTTDLVISIIEVVLSWIGGWLCISVSSYFQWLFWDAV